MDSKKSTRAIAILSILLLLAVSAYFSASKIRYDKGYADGYAKAVSEAAASQSKAPPVSKSTRSSESDSSDSSSSGSSTPQHSASKSSSDSATRSGSDIVYVTRTGAKYHKKGCSYLRSSCIEISLDDAIAQGYDPCSRCWD